MQIIPEYTNPIGVCVNCRSARRTDLQERVVDLGAQVEILAPGTDLGMEYRILDGDFQVCETCWTEGARLLGMETADKVAKAHQVAKDAIEANVRLEAELKDALSALEYRRKVQATADRVFGPEKK